MAIHTIRSGATQHPEYMLDFLESRVIDQSGVVKLGTSFLATEKGTPNMSVDISSGYAYIAKSDSTKTYPVYNSATVNLVIGANSSGNPRIDSIILYMDLGATPNTDATNVAKLLVVAGTPAGSPTRPTDGNIQTAIGASNPFIRLADITVANGAIAIVTANIADARTRCRTIGTKTGYQVASDGATVTFNIESGTKHMVTIAGNRTLAVSNIQEGDSFILKIKQDATGGRTVTWWSGISWDNGITPVLTTTANKANIFTINCTGVGAYEGFVVAESI